jgi:hypothetical protein
MNRLQKILHLPFFIKLFNWEYWSFATVYALIYPVFFGLVIRERFRFFFKAANPRIKNGGFLMESKKEIYDMIPGNLAPATLFFKASTPAVIILKAIEENKFSYPLIIKPDIGMKGLAAQKIESEEEVKKYVPVFAIDFLVQQFIPYANEAGIFYYRYPGTAKGKISGIVAKEFLTVTGDGEKTLGQLLQADKRFILQLPYLQKDLGEKINEVLARGEKKLLVPYGNHARGAKFLDYSSLADEKLEHTIDAVCRQVPDFFYGRLDVRYDNWDDLKEGKNFSVIELNGAGSEPTHMYDPRHSLFFAWKEIIRHWFLLWRISRMNYKRGHRYMTIKEFSRMMNDHKVYIKKLEAVHAGLAEA